MTGTVSALDLPFDEAINFFRQKINIKTQVWTDVYAAAHSRAFMVAGAATDALLDDFRREIQKALEEGTTIEEFRQSFDAIVEKHGWDYRGKRNWRTRIIFDTNLRKLLVPSALEGAARKLLINELGTNGESNEWKGTAEPVVIPLLG